MNAESPAEAGRYVRARSGTDGPATGSVCILHCES